jgi:DAK2 domain fusion protein YloV
MSARRLDAAALRGWAHGAVEDLITHSDEINGLNVFPVADADTGTNMLFTMRSAWVQADDCTGDVAAVAAALAVGALHGARGNSGVILSQILRGLADVTAVAAAERDGALTEVDAALFTAALRRGVDLVVASLGETVPGTIVSVLAAAAGAADAATSQGATLGTAIRAATDAAAAALDDTTGQLDVLADAGVVDAGGRGLLVLLDALARIVTGEAARRHRYAPAPQTARHDGPAAAPPRFEVMYLLSDCRPAGVEALRGRLEELGDSVAIAASGASGGAGYSVHVHADDAGAAVEAGLSVGTLRRIQITALTAAAPARPNGGWNRERAVVAVVDGAGAAELFAGEGAHVLRRPEDGEPVSAKHLLRALVDTGAGRAMVLPNGYVAAEELVAGCAAATGLGVDVVPVPAASMVQGLAALAVHDPARHAVDDGYTMARAAASARHGAVRVATEEALTWAGTCAPGDGLGISGDEVLIVGPDVTAAAAGLIDLLLLSGGELVTVLAGEDAGDEVGEALRTHVHHNHPGTELVTYRTGHRGDALLIGVE